MNLLEFIIIGMSIGFLIGYSAGLLVGYGMIMVLRRNNERDYE